MYSKINLQIRISFSVSRLDVNEIAGKILCYKITGFIIESIPKKSATFILLKY